MLGRSWTGCAGNGYTGCTEAGPSHARACWLVSPDLVGWAASAILIATLAWQIHIQSRDPNARGVSRWLFAGQMLASVGFIAYSWMLDNWVFIVTNAVILLTAVVGQVVVWRKKKRT